MPLGRQYPAYGTPGHPNLDPYYLSEREEAMLNAEAEAAAKALASDRRDALVDMLEDTIADTNDVDATWGHFAEAVVAKLESIGLDIATQRIEP